MRNIFEESVVPIRQFSQNYWFLQTNDHYLAFDVQFSPGFIFFHLETWKIIGSPAIPTTYINPLLVQIFTELNLLQILGGPDFILASVIVQIISVEKADIVQVQDALVMAGAGFDVLNCRLHLWLRDEFDCLNILSFVAIDFNEINQLLIFRL